MKIRRLAIFLSVLLGLAAAQISYPTASFLKALGAEPGATSFEYKGAEVSVSELAGYLYKVSYRGPAGSYEAAADVLAAAIGDEGIKQPFIDWIKKNQQKLDEAEKPVTVGVGRAFFMVIEDGPGLNFQVIPYQVPDSSFGDRGRVIGDSGVYIREYSDFECPYCKMFYEKALPEIEKRYVETGKARFEFNHFPLTEIHKESLNAAMASECAADQGKFWEYHDSLFKNGAGDYAAKAGEAGLDAKKFGECLLSGKHRQDVLDQRQEAINLGLNGTPSVFVGPFLLPNPFDIDAYQRYIAMAQALNDQDK
ncbi:DsbA family protein [Oceanithermus sp.]